MNKNITKNSTLKTNIARLILALVLVVAQAATIVTPVLAAETVSSTSSVTIGGVQYTTIIKQGQAQLTVGSKAILLSKENVMAAITIDQYGTVWTISYSGRCAGYNYELQKNEPTVNLHTYVNNAEEFITNGSYGTAVKTTTGTVNLPTLEEFKKLADFTSSNGNTNNGGNTNTGNNGNTLPSVPNGNTSVITYLFETKNVGNTNYTFIVNNGIARVVVGNDKVITIPDVNICEIGVDANGTIIIMTYNNGIKEGKWYNPTLQKDVVKTNLFASNAYCLMKDRKGLVTGVNMYYSIIKVPTIDEQKKLLGITETTTTTKVDQSRVVPAGDYTFVVYKEDGSRLAKYSFNKKTGVLSWRKVKYKGLTKVRIIKKSHNMVVITAKGNVVTIDYQTMARKTIFKANGSLKAKDFTNDTRGFATAYITTDGIRHSVKSK